MSDSESTFQRVAGSSLALVCTLALIPLTLGLIFERRWWAADVFGQIRLQNTVVLLVIGCAFAIGRNWKWTITAAAGVAISLLVSLPPILKKAPQAEEIEGRTLKILSQNLNFRNTEFDEAIGAIEAANADVVILFEVTLDWQQKLQRLESIYDYHFVEAQSGQFGIAMFSREEFQIDPEPFSVADIQPIIARFRIDSQEITVIGAHAPPALGRQLFDMRKQFLALLAINVQFRDEPVIVAGDFNITPASGAYRDLLKETGLRGAGNPFESTWKSRIPGFGVRIDHALVSEHWRVVSSEAGPASGSDHKMLVTELILK